MAKLKLDGSHEFSHGRRYAVRRGVADGLEDVSSRESELTEEGHQEAYRLGRGSGQAWRGCICGDVSSGMVAVIEKDMRTPVGDPPQNASVDYRLGWEFGKCLTKLIAQAETPSPKPT